MQTLGLSDSTPRTESRLRALFWPTIRNDVDFDYVTAQGFWICFAVGLLTAAVSLFNGTAPEGLFEGAFFLLAGMGVRQRSRIAGQAAFAAYLLRALVLIRYYARPPGFLDCVFLALLFANIRGNWLSARWAKEQGVTEPPVRLNQTIGDRLSDQLPRVVWPKGRFLFYALAGVEVALLLVALVAPRPGR
jgi:hypothetical protein